MPLGPNVNGFEKDLEDFVNEISPCATLSRNDSKGARDDSKEGERFLDKLEMTKRVLALSSGTSAVHLALIVSHPLLPQYLPQYFPQ